jgi:hypothetical protein
MLYKLHVVIIWFTALVWFINGLLCKVINLVPRHTQIVQSILQIDYNKARWLTILIGIAEIIMAIWIGCKIKTKLNAVLQIVVIGIMNVIELVVAPQLLLWGKYNLFFALILIVIIFANEFVIKKQIENKTNA